MQNKFHLLKNQISKFKFLFLIFLTISLMPFLLFGCNSKTNCIDKDYGNEIKDIVIFSTNDVMSAYDDYLGYAKLKYYFDNFDRSENYATLVDIGNFSSGNPVAENSKGKSSIEIMKAIDYDLIVPGSHEFDYGLDVFFENMKELGDKVISCNIINPKTNELYFRPYKIFKYGETKIAYIGVTSPETLMMTDQNIYFNDKGEQILSFCEDEKGEKLYKQIQDTVDKAREAGADKVVLLSHLGIENVTPMWSSTTVIANTKYIDAVIDGHSMEILDNGLMTNKIGAFIPLVQSGSHLHFVGIMNIMKDGYIFPAIISQNSLKTDDEKITELINEVRTKKFN